MLGEKNAAATIPVKDIEVAKSFYNDTLGLKADEPTEEGVLIYKSGDSKVLVYESEFAGTNQATAATWEVGDIEREVKVLRDKGVAFEHYNMPGMSLQGDLHVAANSKAAWFKDPDGNILAIVGK